MDFVNNHAGSVYDRFAPPLVDDAAAALNESIRPAVDANPQRGIFRAPSCQLRA